MSRKSNSAQRRSEIVAGMLAAMAEQGYEKATVQLIAQHAGLAPGLLHYHFKSKAEILLALMDALAAQGKQRFEQMSANAVDARARLHAYVDARLGLGEGADAKAAAAWVMIGAEAVRQGEVRELYQRAVAGEMALVEGLLADCPGAQDQPAEDVRAVAAGLLALVEGAFQLASAAPQAMPTGYAAKAARQMLADYFRSAVS
ncbi:MAG: TetR/AcrR family transcriptional regulator [Pseudomonadota bacterium]